MRVVAHCMAKEHTSKDVEYSVLLVERTIFGYSVIFDQYKHLDFKPVTESFSINSAHSFTKDWIPLWKVSKLYSRYHDLFHLDYNK